jgi:hypothetical protein
MRAIFNFRNSFFTLALGFLAITFSSCLGDTEEQLLGRWRLWEVHPSYPPFELRFYPNGGVEYYNPYTNVSDSGSYTLRAEVSHRVLTINYLTETIAGAGSGKIAAEYVIHRCDENVLVISTNEYSGGSSDRSVTQLDFVRAEEGPQ